MGAAGIGAVEARCLVAGDWRGGPGFAVTDKFTGETIDEVTLATSAMMDDAVGRAAAYDPPGPYERYEILMRARDVVAARADDFVALMRAEAGFTGADARGEHARALQTLAICAEEARRLVGEVVPFAGAKGGAGRFGYTMLVPIGVVLAVTPFNAPLNTVCHKVGPAFAAGNGVVLKPSAKTPLTANLLAECLLEAGVPPASLSVLHGDAGEAQALIADERCGYIAFTGSTPVGRAIQAKAGLRRTQMELGSIAATILCADADVDAALPKCVGASFRKAGQVCTSIQMLFVHDALWDEVDARFAEAAAGMRAGDPRDAGSALGPVISEESAARIGAMIADARGKGARVAGGERQGAVLQPAVLTGTTDAMRVHQEEVFGPVVCLRRFGALDEAIGAVNATPYGLATGVFTRDIGAARRCAERLRVGGVHVNETSSSRIDAMPYGGVKASGFGLEGPRYAIREMSEERLVTHTFGAS